MERYSEVVGLPVICADNGKRIGVVSDIIFNPGSKKVKGFMLERKGCEISKKAVFINDVVNLGKDALVIKDCTCVSKVGSNKKRPELKNRAEVKGLKVYTKSGQDLGIVKDILFDYKTASIEGLEVSDGLLQDIVQGRNILPLFGKVEFSEETVLVDREAIEEMTPTGGGLKNLLMKDEGQKDGKE